MRTLLLQIILILMFMIETKLTHSINLTLSSGPSSLPVVLYGGFIGINSQNELILMGGCTHTGAHSGFISTSSGCSISMASLNVYLWDISSEATYKQIDSINPTNNNNVDFGHLLWNPSYGYPYPIDHNTDIMYIPWYNITYQYDTINKQWINNDKNNQIVTPIPVYHSCNVYDINDKTENKIYLLGGTTFHLESQQYYGSLQIYNIDTNLWTSYLNIASMPISVYGGSCALNSDINHKLIYYFGGRIHTGYGVKSILKYNINENEWVTLNTVLAYETFGGRAIIVNNTNIFIIGGAVLFSSGNINSHLSGIWSFNVIDESIQLVTTMNFPRYAPQTALVNGHIYIGGGKYYPTILSDTEWSIEIFDNNYTDNINTMTTTQQSSIGLKTTAISEGTTEQISSTKMIMKTTIKQTNIAYVSNVTASGTETDSNSMLMVAIISIVFAVIFFICCLVVLSYLVYQKCYLTLTNVNNIKLSLQDDENKQTKYINHEGRDNDQDIIQIVNQTELGAMQQ